MARMPQAERRQQLVEAAIQVMKREGVSKATTRAIVGEAGTSLSVFHYCFASKQELLDAVVRSIVGRSASLAEATLGPGTSLPDAVRGALRAYWDDVTSNPEEHQLTYEVTQFALRDEQFTEVAKLQYQHYLDALAGIFEHLERVYDVQPSWPREALAAYLAAMIDGVTLSWLVRRDGAAAETVLDAMAEQVTALLRAPVRSDS